MPRRFPQDPTFPEDGGAERSVWEALHALPDDVAVFWGQRFLSGRQEYEIDGIVAWPGVGIAVIEVKGGFISRIDGSWFQGSGDQRHRIDPVGQIQGARHALQDVLAEEGVPRARTAHLVAFPHIFVPDTWRSLDLPRDAVLDRSSVEDGTRMVDRVRSAIEEHGQGHGRLSAEALVHLIDVLADTFPSHTENLIFAAMHGDRLEQMTRDQATILENLRNFSRLRVIGGAGTGKTWLALEQARRLAREGKDVALMCYSRGLGHYLERIAQTWPKREQPAYVGLFHNLAFQWGAERGTDDDGDFWEHRLPLELGRLARDRDSLDKFDAVVVDEAQDFGDLWWTSLLDCLREPETGGLYVFRDDAQRVFSREGQAPIDLPPFALGENLRSTKRIAQVFGSFADEQLTPRGMPGPHVRICDQPADKAVDVADDVVEALLDEGWDPGQIVLLTTHRRHPQQVNEVDLGGYANYWDTFFAAEDVFYGHVLGFKGLERDVVVLAVNGFRDMERARELLYTGMSRARTLLVVVGPRGVIEQVGGPGTVKRLERATVWSPGESVAEGS